MNVRIGAQAAVLAFSALALLGGAIAQQGGGGSTGKSGGDSAAQGSSGSSGGSSSQGPGGSSAPSGGSSSQGAGGSSAPGGGSTSQGQGQNQGQGQGQGQSQGQGAGGSSGGSSGGASQGSGGTGASSSGATAKDAPVVGAVPLGVKVEEVDLVAKGWRASRLVKADVYNDQNQKIGKVEDMVIAPDGKLSAAIIDVGGFLGIKRHRVAIPVDQLKFENSKRVVLPGATKDALKQLPEFQYASTGRRVRAS